ncbi:MAG: pilus assembly protein PilM [Candidatus Uhrbacteria bacterium]
MGLFGGNKTHTYLGVDIGTSGLKVVELSNEKGRAKVMTYGYSERQPGQPVYSPFDDPKGTGERLAALCKKAGVRGTKVMAALPLSSVFSTIVSVPKRKHEKEMQPLVDAQVAKLTPMPLSEMVTSTTFIDGKGSKGSEGVKGAEEKIKSSDHVRVLVTGAAKSLVQKYIEIFKVAKLDLTALDTESFALVRSLIGKDKSPIAILDIGGASTSITIVEKGIPVLSRSIGIAGNNVTRRIMDQMSIEETEAEQIKQDLMTVVGTAPGGIGGLPAVLDAVMQPLLTEIRYAFQLYAGMELCEYKKVEKIVVTGGSSHLPRIVEFLKESLNMNVYRGDPWARVVFAEDLRPVLDEIGPRMSVAIGLAMREID